MVEVIDRITTAMIDIINQVPFYVPPSEPDWDHMTGQQLQEIIDKCYKEGQDDRLANSMRSPISPPFSFSPWQMPIRIVQGKPEIRKAAAPREQPQQEVPHEE